MCEGDENNRANVNTIEAVNPADDAPQVETVNKRTQSYFKSELKWYEANMFDTLLIGNEKKDHFSFFIGLKYQCI